MLAAVAGAQKAFPVDFTEMYSMATGYGTMIKNMKGLMKFFGPEAEKHPSQAIYDFIAKNPFFANMPKEFAGQLFTQTEFGRAQYGYKHPGESVVNFKDKLGNEFGAKSFVSADGKEIRVSFIAADPDGFKVLSNDLSMTSTMPIVELPDEIRKSFVAADPDGFKVLFNDLVDVPVDATVDVPVDATVDVPVQGLE